MILFNKPNTCTCIHAQSQKSNIKHCFWLAKIEDELYLIAIYQLRWKNYKFQKISVPNWNWCQEKNGGNNMCIYVMWCSEYWTINVQYTLTKFSWMPRKVWYTKLYMSSEYAFKRNNLELVFKKTAFDETNCFTCKCLEFMNNLVTNFVSIKYHQSIETTTSEINGMTSWLLSN